LRWWAKAQREYPHVAILARKYLVVQASSLACERVFFVGGLGVRRPETALVGIG
ncbi:unnamed protein product, partial [Sphacelaria rigidula]